MTKAKTVVDPNGDEFIEESGQWSWVDMDGIRVGLFDTKEEARKDAYDKCWLWKPTFYIIGE